MDTHPSHSPLPRHAQGAPVRSLRRHHTTNKRPLSRWRGHVSSASMDMQHGMSMPCSRRRMSGRYAFCWGAPMRTLAAATACVHLHVRVLLRCRGVAQQRRSTRPNPCCPPVGPARPKPSSEGSQGVHRNPRLAASGGWIGLAGTRVPSGRSSPLPRRRHGALAAATARAAPRMYPPAPLAAASHAEGRH